MSDGTEKSTVLSYLQTLVGIGVVVALLLTCPKRAAHMQELEELLYPHANEVQKIFWSAAKALSGYEDDIEYCNYYLFSVTKKKNDNGILTFGCLGKVWVFATVESRPVK